MDFLCFFLFSRDFFTVSVEIYTNITTFESKLDRLNNCTDFNEIWNGDTLIPEEISHIFIAIAAGGARAKAGQ